MKIATMVSGYVTTPQPLGVTWAPIDVAVAISEGLQILGHSVDYYGPEGSEVNVPLVTCGLNPFPRNEHGEFAYPNAPGQEENLRRVWDEYLITEMLRRANSGEYDALIIHPIDHGLLLGRLLPNVPVIYPLHDPIVPWRAEIYKRFLSPNQHLVSITDAQRQSAPELSYAATIYNGIDTAMFAFSETPQDHVLFAGRMIREKGVVDGVRAAQQAGVSMKLFGEVPLSERKYFDEEVQPLLGEAIRYEGFLDRHELAGQYGAAKAILAPIQWDEPFGLVLTEAMACGTPVIAFRRGSVPEIVVDGKTGFIVDTVEEMADAIKKIDTIDRAACRQHVLEKFSNERMAKGYEQLLKDLPSSS